MQAWKNGVRARHAEDGKVASAPGRNVLDHCEIAHTHIYHTTRKSLFSFPGEGVLVVVSLTTVSVD